MRNIAMAAVVFCVVTLSTARAEPPTASKFCTSLDEVSARSSTECVRWYFACRLAYPSGVAKPPYDHLSYETRYRLAIDATLRITETACDHFSYVEAWAAIQSKTFSKQGPANGP
jgi:hypothetical protein